MKALSLLKNKMNTLQFAELTGTSHKNVLAKTRKLLINLGIEAAEFSATYISSTGEQIMLELDRDLSLTLAGQYEPKIAYHVAKAFGKAAEKIAPQTLLEALKLAVLQQEQLERLTGENDNLHAAIDNIFGYSSILRAAQHVGVHESAFSWRVLKPKAIMLNLPPKKVPSPRFEYQLLYPIQAFVECYPDYDYDGITPHNFIENPEI